ncbi:MAG: elongation factor Ts [Bacteroidetes bacterium]|nr:MAG: elongation factor Ts [Bacteroidota bacterium]
MTQIKAAEVSKLRKITGAGMMDCKKALQESDGDFDKAIEIIRKKGQAVANKRADREATEGVVLAKVNKTKNKGAIIALNCETDFVAKNADFIKFTQSILDLALNEEPSNLDGLKGLKLGDSTVQDLITEKVGIIGEKLDLAYYDKITAPTVTAYIHPGNKLASIVGLSLEADSQVGKDVAMQVAAMSPVAVDKEGVSQKVIDTEIEIGKEQAKREGKPDNLLEKIAFGKLNKFFKENTLLNQAFVKENKKTVKQYLQEQNKELTVTEFKRFTLNI